MNHTGALKKVHQRVSMDSQLQKKNRMNRANKDDKRKPEKKEADKKAAPSKALRKKRAGATQDDDDEDVDSKGNVRGLIAYSEESEDEEEDEESPRRGASSRRGTGFRHRKAAVKAEKKI